jgi:hypothetical protein
VLLVRFDVLQHPWWPFIIVLGKHLKKCKIHWMQIWILRRPVPGLYRGPACPSGGTAQRRPSPVMRHMLRLSTQSNQFLDSITNNWPATSIYGSHGFDFVHLSKLVANSGSSFVDMVELN